VVASGWVVCVPASVIFPRTIKSIRWRAVIEEVHKGRSEFCVTVGTATRTAGILIHSRLKALDVNLSWPSSQLWLYAGLIGLTTLAGSKHYKTMSSQAVDLVVYVNPSFSWVLVGECFFWYRLTRDSSRLTVVK